MIDRIAQAGTPDVPAVRDLIESPTSVASDDTQHAWSSRAAGPLGAHSVSHLDDTAAWAATLDQRVGQPPGQESSLLRG